MDGSSGRTSSQRQADDTRVTEILATIWKTRSSNWKTPRLSERGMAGVEFLVGLSRMPVARLERLVNRQTSVTTDRWAANVDIQARIRVFNLTNTSVVLRRITVNGPNYLKPLATSGIDAASANPIPAPRIFRLSARYRF